MSTIQLTEEGYERTLIELFQELGYEYECGYDVERDFRNPYYEADLKAALRRQNPMLADDVLDVCRMWRCVCECCIITVTPSPFHLLHCDSIGCEVTKG